MSKQSRVKPLRFVNAKITATISISLVLFLFGIVLLLSLFTNNFSNYMKETMSFDLLLEDSISDDQIAHLQDRLNQTEFVKSTQYISKEDAAKQIGMELDHQVEDFLGFNPLPAIIAVNFYSQYANSDSLSRIQMQLKGFSSSIKSMDYQEELLDMANDNLRRIAIFVLLFALLLLFISYALISSTIRLMIYSKRFLIYTMQLVGAKRSFIRRPFVRSNLLLGILAAFLACGLLAGLFYYLSRKIQDILLYINWESLAITGACLLVLGILIAWISTQLAVNKYLRMERETLNYY
ncbi:MAG: permease-like cell division protein FtsX [Dysgonamonadaceae bacterium]|nr:permease-like cell division protein FtsX [Dysgonamonadaceae bacterium]